MSQIATTTCNFYMINAADNGPRNIVIDANDGGSTGQVLAYNPVDGSTIPIIGGQVSKSICVTVTDTATTSTSSSIGYNGPNFQEWLLVAGIIIFFLSMSFWSKLFGPIKKLFNYDN